MIFILKYAEEICILHLSQEKKTHGPQPPAEDLRPQTILYLFKSVPQEAYYVNRYYFAWGQTWIDP